MSRHTKRSPLKAIRAFCVECQGDSFQAVSECKDTACPFYAYRSGDALPAGQHKPMSAIKAYCFGNCLPGASREAIADCQGNKAYAGPCPVFPFRLGKNPNISEETREKARQRELRKVADGSNPLLKLPAHRLFDVL